MDLHATVIQAQALQRSWNGTARFELEGGDEFTIESDGVDHLRLPIPEGKTYSIRITLAVDEL